MVRPPEFATLAEMDASPWLAGVAHAMLDDIWPEECRRCEQTEQVDGTSVRTHALKFDRLQRKQDYLTVGGVLDNICNSACQFCSEGLSTKIGSLRTRDYPIVDNTRGFWALPQDRITHLDLNGGEPSHSKNYKAILANLPANVESIRLNTNASTVLTELVALAERGIRVTVTVSFDGVGATHNYVRWPIAWEKFVTNLLAYKSMPVELNLWTTVNALNVNNMPEMFDFVAEHELDHSWSLLQYPQPLNVEYTNSFTERAKNNTHSALSGIRNFIATKENNQEDLDAYIAKQDALRNINIKDYL